jgi:hypothetical protein
VGFVEGILKYKGKANILNYIIRLIIEYADDKNARNNGVVGKSCTIVT